MQFIATLLLLLAAPMCGHLGAQDHADQVASISPARTLEAHNAEALRFREMLAKYRPLPTDEFTVPKVNNNDRSALFEVYIDIPELNEVRATTVLFTAMSYEVDESHLPWLDHYANILEEYPLAMVRIEAHTDSVGRISDNQTLSELRAMEVKHQLILRGIGAERISAVGMGERSPSEPNTQKEGRRLNRRVEFKTYFPIKRP